MQASQNTVAGPGYFAEVERLVIQLYHPSSPHQVAETQASLQRLQRSPSGWQLADALLHSNDVNVRFFGALTFTIKINSDWDSLKEEDTGPILTRLLQWLALRVNAGETVLVTKKLCSTLVAYFLRPSVSWNRCLLHVICCLSEGRAISYDELITTSNKDVILVISALRKTQLLTALWFATVLIEEVSKTNPFSLKTNKYHDRVLSNMDDLVRLLLLALEIKPQQDTEVAEEGMKCYKSWIIYAHGAWIDKTIQLAPLRTLTPYSLRHLWYSDLFEAAADSLTEIMGTFSDYFTPGDLEALASFLTSERAQKLLSTLVHGDFESDAVAFARLLLAYGDIKLQDLAQQPNDPTSQIIMRGLVQLLACEGWAGADDDICSPALEFWQSFLEFLIDALYAEEEHADPWMGAAQQFVVQVLEQCWAKVRMPAEDIFARWTSDAKGDFKAFRTDVEDLLQSSYTLLGTAIFNRLAGLALEALNSQAWLHLEATLFCLNALSEAISDEDVVDGTLSTLFGSTLFTNMMNSELSIPAKTQQTAVSTIINFMAFFERHVQFLPSMLTFLFVSLRNPVLAGKAGKAILSTCDSCRQSLVPEVGAFLSQYDALVRWSGVEAGIKEKVIGAIAAIVQAIPSSEAKVESFSKLITFVEQDVSACQTSARGYLLEEAQEQGLCALRCLINMGKSSQEPADIAIDLEADSTDIYDPRIWGDCQTRIVRCIEGASSALGKNGDVVEASCQVLRTGYKESSPGPFVFPPKVTEDFVVSSRLDTPRLDHVLDTAGALLARHTRVQVTAVSAAATAFLLHLFQLIATMNYDPSNEPEIASSCIELASKYIPYHLHVFLDPRCQGQVSQFIEFTIQSIRRQDIMPRRSAALFWSSFVQNRRYEYPNNVSAMVDWVLEQFGPQVVQVIVHNISGEAARSELETLADPLRKIVVDQARAKQWIWDALFSSSFPSSKVSEADKRVWLQQVMKWVTPPNPQTYFQLMSDLSLRGAKKTNQVVKEFWMACRGTDFAYTS
ncbi:MAG: hypothetical protein Q9218_002671 [Villophora microphyllina]